MFVLILSPTNHDAMTTLTQAICGDVFATHSDVKLNFCEYHFLLATSLRNRTVPYRTQESRECKRQLRRQKQRGKKTQQDLTVIQKTNANEEKSLGWRNKPGKLATSETT